MAAKVTLSRIVYKKWMSGYVVGGKWVSGYQRSLVGELFGSGVNVDQVIYCHEVRAIHAVFWVKSGCLGLFCLG